VTPTSVHDRPKGPFDMLSRTRRFMAVGGVSLLCTATVFTTATPAYAATTYNLVNQFSNLNTWGAFYQTCGTCGDFELETPVQNFCDASGLNGWSNGGAVPNLASAVVNDTKNRVSCVNNNTVIVPNKTVNLDPESLPLVFELFFVPAAGNYTITGHFVGDDTAEQAHTVEIAGENQIKNVEKILYSTTISAYGQVDKFNITHHFSSESLIGFLVETGSGPDNLSTGLRVTITGP
jgi:hypothetical protein